MYIKKRRNVSVYIIIQISVMKIAVFLLNSLSSEVSYNTKQKLTVYWAIFKTKPRGSKRPE